MVLLWSAATSVAFAAATEFQKIAKGVYVAVAPNEAPSPDNRGYVSNLGFIVGSRGVVAIGTGAGEHHGRDMLAAIRRITRKPVVLAIDLQATPDHVLGNRSFARLGIPILAHRETDRFMLHNCANCIRNARRAIGAARMGPAAVVRPNRLVDASQTTTDGGTDLELRYVGPTFQAGSLMVFDRSSGVLFAGEVLSVDRLPDVRNADFDAWEAALRDIAGSSITAVVPAHGAPVPPGRARELLRYLTELQVKVLDAYDRGVPMQDAAEAATMPEYAGWALYRTLHAGNVHFTFLKIETLDLAR